MINARRRERLGELVREEVAMLVLREELPEDAVATITRVTLSDDLAYAEIVVSVLPETLGEEVARVLQQSAPEFQRVLNKRMRMRPVPRIHFVLEQITAEADRVEAELYKLKKEN